MGLFDNNTDDDGKSFREEVEEIRQEREQESGSTGHTESEETGHMSSVDLGTPVPDTDTRQYQYKTVNLLEESDSGLLGKMIEQQQGPALPDDEVLNHLGKDGWRLIETIEKPATEVGSFAGHEGSMTYALIFRRPVSYQDGE